MVLMKSVTVDIRDVKFRVRHPNLTSSEERTYRKKALQFCQEALVAIPRYFPSLSSGSPTVTQETHVGRDSSIYFEREVVGKGMSATVMRVVKQGSGLESAFIAKEPFYKHSDNSGDLQHKWEETRLEYEKLIKLSLVCDNNLPLL
jgi:hypothetical protein